MINCNLFLSFSFRRLRLPNILGRKVFSLFFLSFFSFSLFYKIFSLSLFFLSLFVSNLTSNQKKIAKKIRWTTPTPDSRRRPSEGAGGWPPRGECDGGFMSTPPRRSICTVGSALLAVASDVVPALIRPSNRFNLLLSSPHTIASHACRVP